MLAIDTIYFVMTFLSFCCLGGPEFVMLWYRWWRIFKCYV